MDPNLAKRRKLGHPSGGPSLQNGIASTPAANAFIEATEELLSEVKVDYTKTFEGVDDTLKSFKETIEALEPHDPLPVS
jgi:U3 small nucleolar RNA-associated protein 22